MTSLGNDRNCRRENARQRDAAPCRPVDRDDSASSRSKLVPPVSRPSEAPAPTLLQRICDPRIAWPALKVALIVGIMLNAVNNGDRLSHGDAINWWQFALNVVVPFCVSSYSAARNDLLRAGDD